MTSAEASRPSAPRAALAGIGVLALDVPQVLGEATVLPAATLRQLRLRRADLDRLAGQLVRIGTETLPIAALLVVRRHGAGGQRRIRCAR